MKFIDKLLTYFNIKEEEYNKLIRDVNESSIPLFSCFDNLSLAKERILKAIENKEKVLIYGDYDADGILATSILVKTFKKLNFEVSYYIPSRYLDGYGLTKDKVEIAKQKNYSLIITVDNGVSAKEAIKACKENYIDLIITDHHEYINEPDCYAFIHPKKSTFSINTSGAVVSFYLSYALLGSIDKYLLSLAGTSIISDAMPMVNENRNIVRLALKYLNNNNFNSFRMLADTFVFDESTLSVNVIPKINAVGRIEKMKEANILVKFFTTDNYKDLLNIKSYLINVNEKRKNITTELLHNITFSKDDPSIFIIVDTLSGLTGLIANKLMSENDKPVVVFSSIEEKDGFIRGSIRSKNGCDITKFLNENANLFKEFGGHSLAAGIVIKKEDFDKVKDKFNNYVINNEFKTNRNFIEILNEDLTLENYYLIKTFSPFGEQWKEPTFLIKNVDMSEFKIIGKNNNTLVKYLNSNKDKIIGFNINEDFIKNNHFLDIYGKFNLNTYKNQRSLNFILEK